MEKWIRLHPVDNVLIARVSIEAGEEIIVNGQCIKTIARVALGNKLASKDIHAGEQIIKYGVPVGSAFLCIPAGTLVHTHNMKSNYIPTYTR